MNRGDLETLIGGAFNNVPANIGELAGDKHFINDLSEYQTRKTNIRKTDSLKGIKSICSDY